MLGPTKRDAESKNIVLVITWVLVFILLVLVMREFFKSKEIKKVSVSAEQKNIIVEEGPEYTKVIESRWLTPKITRKYGQNYGNNIKPKSIQQALETFDKNDVGDNFIQKLNETNTPKKTEDLDGLSSQLEDSKEKLEQNSENKELAKQVQIGEVIQSFVVENFNMDKLENK